MKSFTKAATAVTIECNGEKETDWASELLEMDIDSDGQIGFASPECPEIQGIDVQPASHSKSTGAPESGVNVTLMGESFTSNFKAKLYFKKEGESDVKLTYPEQGVEFLDGERNSNSFSINIPKDAMDKFAEESGIGNYIIEAVVGK